LTMEGKLYHSTPNEVLDPKFSTAFPEFVDGEEPDDEVAVGHEQLKKMVKGSLELVKWCAVQIRAKQLDWARADDDANLGRRVFRILSREAASHIPLGLSFFRRQQA